MQHLTLPEPANILFTTVYEELAKTLPSVLPENGRWRLGGGTVLAARWRHRASSDLDIFLPERSMLAALRADRDRSFTERMEKLGATHLDLQDRSLKFHFPSGRVELTQLDARPALPPEIVRVDGHEIAIDRIEQILTGKLFGRGFRLPPRDVFDIAVANEEAPEALRCAVNYLMEEQRADTKVRIYAEADAYREQARTSLEGVHLKWLRLLGEAPERAAAAIRLNTYEHAEVEHRPDGTFLRLHLPEKDAAVQGPFASGRALAERIVELGLENRMFDSRDGKEGFAQRVDAERKRLCV